MARPKSHLPKKQPLNLSVTEQTRLELTYIANHREMSISELIAEYAAKESRKIAKKTNLDIPQAGQMDFADFDL